MKKLSLFLLVLTLLPAAVRAQSVSGYVDHAVVTRQVNEGARLSANSKGKELLQAISKKNSEKALRLIRAGASLSVQDEDGKTALHYAIENYDKALVKALIKAGAGLSIQDKREHSPLDLVTRPRTWGKDKNYEEYRKWESVRADIMIDLLAAAKAGDESEVQKAWFSYADSLPQDRSGEVLSAFLKAGVDVNAKNEYGKTALMTVADGRWGNPEDIKTLLDAHADVNMKDDEGRTALEHVDFDDGNSGMAEVLIEYGADYHLSDLRKFRVVSERFALFAIDKKMEFLSDRILDFAVKENNLKVLRALKAAGMLPKKATVDMKKINNADVAKFLFDNGLVGEGAEDLFIKSVKKGDIALAESLIGKVNVNKKIYSKSSGNVLWFLGDDLDWHRESKGGYIGTVLGMAVENRDVSMVDMLLAHGANPNIKNDFTGAYPLYDAVIQGNIDMAKLLLNAGAKVDAYNKSSYAIEVDDSNRVEAKPHLSQEGFVQEGKGHYASEAKKRVPEGYAIEYAVERNDAEMVKLLIKYGSKKLSDAMHMAGETKNLEMVELLRKYGANVCALKGTELDNTEAGYNLTKNCRKS